MCIKPSNMISVAQGVSCGSVGKPGHTWRVAHWATPRATRMVWRRCSPTEPHVRCDPGDFHASHTKPLEPQLSCGPRDFTPSHLMARLVTYPPSHTYEVWPRRHTVARGFLSDRQHLVGGAASLSHTYKCVGGLPPQPNVILPWVCTPRVM